MRYSTRVAKRSKRTSARAPRGRAKPKPRAAKRRASGHSALQDFCRALPGTTEDIKWEHDLVFSVGGKMYAAFDVEDADQLGFKCDDMEFERLTRVDGVIPAPYAARFGWVKVTRRGALPAAALRALIRRSHELVLAQLPAKVRAALKG